MRFLIPTLLLPAAAFANSGNGRLAERALASEQADRAQA